MKGGAEILRNLLNDFYIELENKRKKKLKRNVRKLKNKFKKCDHDYEWLHNIYGD